jgi:hypothetical protein
LILIFNAGRSNAQVPPLKASECNRTSLDFTTANQYLSIATSPLNGTAGTFEGWIQRDDWQDHTTTSFSPTELVFLPITPFTFPCTRLACISATAVPPMGGKSIDNSSSAIQLQGNKPLELSVVVGDSIITKVKVTTGVDGEMEIGIKVFPIPTFDFLHVQIRGEGITYQSKVDRLYDLLGQQLIQNEFVGREYSLDLTQQQPGIYLLVLEKQ